jgi:hypothetical protein
MSARTELVAFSIVAAIAVGSIIAFALSSERRATQPLSGTILQVPAEGGVCPTEVRVKNRADGPLEICAIQCAPDAATDGQCTCTVDRDRCRETPTPAR